MIASLAGDILLSQVNSKGTQNHTQCSKRAEEVSLLLSSTSTVISLATYIIQKAHKWTDSGRQWCHFTLTSYYTVNIESFTANGKTSIWTTWPRFCHLLFTISSHKKVVLCHVHAQKWFGQFLSSYFLIRKIFNLNLRFKVCRKCDSNPCSCNKSPKEDSLGPFIRGKIRRVLHKTRLK